MTNTTKPTFYADYPIATVALGNTHVVQRFVNVIPTICAALEAGEILNPVFAEVKSAINAYVDSTFKFVIGNKYCNRGQYETLPEALQWFDTLYEARLIGSFEKKIAKVAHIDHQMVRDMTAICAELKELQYVVEYLKSVCIKATVKAKQVKEQKELEAVCRNQTDIVYQTVLPMKIAAQDRAEEETRKAIAYHIEQLAKVGYNIDTYAPLGVRPEYRSNDYETQKVRETIANQFRAYIISFVKRDAFLSGIVKIDTDAIEYLAGRARRDAGIQFEAYVVKLNQKINDTVLSATLTGNLWMDSKLTVATANKGVQVWNTHMILNVSKYGRVFNQWPTRLSK
jgi:hypothetical protein